MIFADAKADEKQQQMKKLVAVSCEQSHFQLQYALDVDLVTQAHVHTCVSTYNKVMYEHVLGHVWTCMLGHACMDMCLCYQVDV